RTYTNLEWKTVGDVDETLIEISANSDFKILDSVVKTKKLSTGIPTSLPQGQYFVRLKGYNKNRELSATSTVHSFNLTDIKRSLLSPPLLITQNIKHLDSDIAPPKMAWEKVESAANYRIELSRTPRFEKSVKAETASSEVTWPGVQAGSYFFRVYSLNGEDVSLPSDIGTLEISSQAPQLLPISAVSIRSENKNLGPQRIPLKWLHTTRAKPLYRIEVSKSGTFQDAKIIKSERAPATVSVTQPGEYYVR
ncbi:MAG: hypothetical protein ACK5V3_00910, partial [Bdellovibrionales bacterium]